MPTMSISSCIAAVIVGMSPSRPPSRRPAEKPHDVRAAPEGEGTERLAQLFELLQQDPVARMAAPIMAAG